MNKQQRAPSLREVVTIAQKRADQELRELLELRADLEESEHTTPLDIDLLADIELNIMRLCKLSNYTCWRLAA